MIVSLDLLACWDCLRAGRCGLRWLLWGARAFKFVCASGLPMHLESWALGLLGGLCMQMCVHLVIADARVRPVRHENETVRRNIRKPGYRLALKRRDVISRSLRVVFVCVYLVASFSFGSVRILGLPVSWESRASVCVLGIPYAWRSFSSTRVVVLGFCFVSWECLCVWICLHLGTGGVVGICFSSSFV